MYLNKVEKCKHLNMNFIQAGKNKCIQDYSNTQVVKQISDTSLIEQNMMR